MKIVVIGPGALGCLLAASLGIKSTGHEIWLLDRDQNRAAFLAKQGLTLEEADNQYSCRVNATADIKKIGQSADLFFLCVKTHDVENSLKHATPLFTENSLLVTFQNGIKHLDIVGKMCGHILWAAGITAQGATLVKPGHIRHGGQGLTRLGLLHNQKNTDMKRLQNVAALLTSADVKTEIVPNIIDHIWNKLLVNVGINPLTAILSCPNGQLIESAEAETKLTAAVLEAADVAHAKGIAIEEDPVAMTKQVCQATKNNISSMLQDVQKKRRTEIDAINGALVEEAHSLGIPAPVNEELVRKIKEIESTYLNKF